MLKLMLQKPNRRCRVSIKDKELAERLAHVKGQFKGIGVAAKEELEEIETSIAAAKALIESLERRKMTLQGYVKLAEDEAFEITTD